MKTGIRVVMSGLLLLVLLWGVVGSLNFPTRVLAAPMGQTAGTAVVHTGALNVRSGPGVGYSAIAVAYQGQTLTLLGRLSNNSWVKVQLANGTQGWVNATLVQPSIALSGLPVIDVPALTAVTLVNTGALNVRSGPGLTYGAVAVASYGQTLALLGRDAAGVWVKVQLANGTQGWVNATYTQPSVSISSLTVVAAPPAPTPVSPTPLTPTPTPVANVPTAVIHTGALNVRSGPGLGYSVVATVYNGQSVTLLGRSGSDADWVKVRLATGQEGWLNITYTQANVSASSLPIVDGPPALSVATVNTGAANVRSGPGLTYASVAVVYQGQLVTLLGRNSDSSWLKVQLTAGQQGWINTSLLQMTVAVSGLPVVP